MVNGIDISEGLAQFPSPPLSPVQEDLMPFSGHYRHCVHIGTVMHKQKRRKQYNYIILSRLKEVSKNLICDRK